MRNKKLINRRNAITQGWQFCSPQHRLGKGREKKRKKSYCNTGYSYLVTHPSTNFTEQGLTLLNRRNMLLSLWYRDSTLNEFLFLISKMRKGIEKTYLILHSCKATFPAMQYQICLFCTFSHLRNLTKCVQRRVTIPQGQHHVSSLHQS